MFVFNTPIRLKPGELNKKKKSLIRNNQKCKATSLNSELECLYLTRRLGLKARRIKINLIASRIPPGLVLWASD